MSIYDFGSPWAQTYKERCECGRDVEVSTQKNENPEYITSIYVHCVCGRSLPFNLPVN